jgi:hypothetical protein
LTSKLPSDIYFFLYLGFLPGSGWVNPRWSTIWPAIGVGCFAFHLFRRTTKLVRDSVKYLPSVALFVVSIQVFLDLLTFS